MRPRDLSEVVGQNEAVAQLKRMLDGGKVASLILWGPPGSGKTTLARAVAKAQSSPFRSLSAVTSGVKEVKEVIEQARGRKGGLLLFVDEIHRFNKAQQDAFLPHVEDGTITFIGATTENPSFEVISPLLSRVKVLVLQALSPETIRALLDRALRDPERGLGSLGLAIEPEAADFLAAAADGDARRALNALELCAQIAGPRGTIAGGTASEAIGKRMLRYDKQAEEHYSLISALHKALRGSDPDASLYWLARMLEAGEEPLYLARRLVRFASEDVGLADPHALVQALAAKEAFHFIGSPEGELALAQCVIYLACAPKSNAVYTAYSEARRDAASGGSLPVPLHIRNAPTRLMKELGYGEGYRYPHDHPDALVAQGYFPDGFGPKNYYRPTDRGMEARIAERLAAWRKKA